MTKRLIRTSDDLKLGHWMTRQLPAGTSLRGYSEERAIAVITRAVQKAIDDAGLSRSDVAKVLGTTKSYVSQVLNGSTNMTLKTLGALLWASGQQVNAIVSDEVGSAAKRDNKLSFTLPYTFTPAIDPISPVGSGTGLRQAGHG